MRDMQITSIGLVILRVRKCSHSLYFLIRIWKCIYMLTCFSFNSPVAQLVDAIFTFTVNVFRVLQMLVELCELLWVL
jgi:hypothetical protein